MNVLVVDHDDAGREAAAATFLGLGAIVLAVSSADRALQILRAEPSIALMFINIDLAGMGGILLAALARRARPGLSIALTTGQAGVTVPPLYRTVPTPWNKAMLAELLSHARVPRPPVADLSLRNAH